MGYPYRSGRVVPYQCNRGHDCPSQHDLQVEEAFAEVVASIQERVFVRINHGVG